MYALKRWLIRMIDLIAWGMMISSLIVLIIITELIERHKRK